MRFKFDPTKSKILKLNPKRGIDLHEAQQVWEHPYYLDHRSDDPEQFRAIGWAHDMLVSVIFEIRHDDEGEYCHLVTLWRSTPEEKKIYEENCN